MFNLTPMAGRAFGRESGVPVPRARVDSVRLATVQVPEVGVVVIVDGNPVDVSTPLLITLRDGAMKAALEVDQKTGQTGVPIEVRHIRD